jgi:hypothetical protein
MNENPWANAPAHKKANAPNATAIRFANPKVANCKTVDLTNLRKADRIYRNSQDSAQSRKS